MSTVLSSIAVRAALWVVMSLGKSERTAGARSKSKS